LVLLAVLALVMAAAALLVRRVAPAEGAVRHVRRRTLVAVAVGAVALVAAAAALEGRPEAVGPQPGAGATRLSSTDSNRYAYWQVALETFADHPLRGHGSGSFAVDWLRERDVPEVVRDAHSLELETAAELGLVGLVLLALLLGGVVAAAVRAPAAGPIAGLSVWAAHSALDWDWEMPALTLVALILAGLLLAAADDYGRRTSTRT
jgi:O-antigen ligase